MDNSKALNAGIVGLGRWGQKLVKSINQILNKSNSLKFTHAFSRIFEKVKLFCSEFNFNHCNTFDELLTKNIDLIVLATPQNACRPNNKVSSGQKACICWKTIYVKIR